MPRAILALRSYPLAILMALVLFLCSLILATSSTGIIGGGEDSGSGMGGTGRNGLPGDSGFGGTGGPSPFLGEVGTDSDRTDNTESQPDPVDWPTPWLQRETETAALPDEIAPLQELQRNPLRDPTLQAPVLFPDNPDALRIIEQDTSGLPSHLRQQLDLANSGEVMRESAPIDIQLQIPEISAPDPVDMPVLQRHLESQQAQIPAPANDDENAEPLDTMSLETPETLLSGEAEAASQQSDNYSVAGQNNEEIPEILTETPEIDDPRATTERIQRPELPPFQRMRPAVDRASVLPTRPQPMRI